MPKKENGNFTEAELRAFTGEVPVASESKKQTSSQDSVPLLSGVQSPVHWLRRREMNRAKNLFSLPLERMLNYPLRLYLPRRLTRHPQQCDG